METPMLNVNLKPCTCGGPLPRLLTTGPDVHPAGCPGAPVLIPCPIPRSVTFTVRLGECDYPRDACRFGHLDGCRAYPIRVSCSIFGKTWKESEVADIDNPAVTSAEMFSACRDRWALVKALVTGEKPDHDSGRWTGPTLPLFTQRDAVFAALCEMTRTEVATLAARDAVRKARGLPPSKPLARELRESAIELGDYVERLIEQVGDLT